MQDILVPWTLEESLCRVAELQTSKFSCILLISKLLWDYLHSGRHTWTQRESRALWQTGRRRGRVARSGRDRALSCRRVKAAEVSSPPTFLCFLTPLLSVQNSTSPSTTPHWLLSGASYSKQEVTATEWAELCHHFLKMLRLSLLPTGACNRMHIFRAATI